MNSSQTLPMVFCIDDNFAPHLAALLTSIIANTQSGNSFIFYVFSAELSEENKMKLKHTVGENHHIAFNHINAKQFENSQVSQCFSSRLSIVTYFRILIPEVLKELQTKVLFMDADMIVNTDLAELFAIDLNGQVAGVVKDSLVEKFTHAQSLGIAAESYFNAGLIMMDLPAWRQKEISRKAMELINLGKNFKFNDQDILNITLERNLHFFDDAWNVQQSSLERFTVVKDAKAIHYNGAEKPWQFASIHPFTQLYLHYKGLSPYADTPLVHFLDEHDKRLIERIFQTQSTHIYIYGAGQKGRRLASYLQTEAPEISLVGMIDSSPQMTVFNGVQVSSILPRLKNEVIVVASFAYADEIVEQLMQRSVPLNRIIALCDRV